MNTPSIFSGGLLGVAFAITAWAGPASTERLSGLEYLNEDTLPADIYLKLSSLRCENCTLVVRDLIEVGAVGNNIGAVKTALNGDSNYTFRLDLLTSCVHCYRAAHFWEMNMLNRPAGKDEIRHWLDSEKSGPLVEYFSKS